MSARPDVPDTPDRTDAIARLLRTAEIETLSKHLPDMRPLGWDDLSEWVRVDLRETADRILATDDPAAVAALAATLAERHPDALLTALTNAGVLRREGHCDSARAAHAEGDYRAYACADFDAACPPDRFVTPWPEVQQP